MPTGPEAVLPKPWLLGSIPAREECSLHGWAEQEPQGLNTSLCGSREKKENSRGGQTKSRKQTHGAEAQGQSATAKKRAGNQKRHRARAETKLTRGLKPEKGKMASLLHDLQQGHVTLITRLQELQF
eukprot:1136787-Pelagomonas_calceolata.AAC.12